MKKLLLIIPQQIFHLFHRKVNKCLAMSHTKLVLLLFRLIKLFVIIIVLKIQI